MVAQPLSLTLVPSDLAGKCPPQSTPWTIHQRLQTLTRRYLTPERLGDRLTHLPQQFQQPTPRPWKRIDWSSIEATQIIGIEPHVFLAILAGAADTEDPIRGYAQTSRQYLAPLYPPMARLVGGHVDAQHQLLEMGLWEKEERQHTPALLKLYTQLTGLKLRLVTRTPRSYQPTGNPRQDLYHHGLHRIATEYGAACLYLWLMAYTTGALQAVLEELLIDEINHLITFWSFGQWAYPDANLLSILHTIGHSALQAGWTSSGRGNSLLHTLQRMTQDLHWEAWSLTHQASFLWTFCLTLAPLRSWSQSLTPAYLQTLFGDRPPLS